MKEKRRFSKSNPAVEPSHRGRLHRKLHVPLGEKIPISKLAEAARSSNPEERKEAVYAKTMRTWKRGKKSNAAR